MKENLCKHSRKELLSEPKLTKTHQCTPGRLDFANQQLSTMQPALQNGSVELEKCAVEIDGIVLMRAGFQNQMQENHLLVDKCAGYHFSWSALIQLCSNLCNDLPSTHTHFSVIISMFWS